MCDRAAETCPFFPGPAHRIHWSFPDPAAAEGSDDERLEVFRRVRDGIRERVFAYLAQPGKPRMEVQYNAAVDLGT